MSIKERSCQYGKVFDHWQIKEFLGSGSGGKTAVFRLVRSDSNRGVSALKVINLIEARSDINSLSEVQRKEYETARDECSRNAEREVWLMDDLRGNTNIVDYLDHTFVDWSDESGFGRDLLIRMELLKDLRSEIQRGKIFTEREVLKIGHDICVALIRCHRKNILHRDVKPENIFRNKDGDYKLGDFGVSRVLDACPGAVASTGIGTYEYWPAEQMSGHYDKRVDIYSLGLVLYELSNQNRLPFATSTYVTGKEVSMRLAGTPLPEPIDASPALAKVILKACAFDPKERYQSAEEFLRALNRVIRSARSEVVQQTTTKPTTGMQKKSEYATLPAEASEVEMPSNEYRTMPAGADKQKMRTSFSTGPVKKKAYATELEEKYVPEYVPQKNGNKNKHLKLWIALAVLGLCMLSFSATFLFLDSLYKQKPNVDSKPNAPETVIDNVPEKEKTAMQTLEIIYEERKETTEVTTEATTTEATMPSMTAEDIINILVAGHNEETNLGDTTILVSVNTYNSTVTLYSVLRDSYVKLPDYKGHVCGRAKFPICYGLGYTWGGTVGAMEMTNICMKDNFGVEVDHNIEIDFEGFIKIIDHLGGVEIELTEEEAKYLNKDDQYVHYDVKSGLQHLDGMAALSYARMEGDGDLRRSARQCHLIEILLEQVRDLNLSELQDIADAMLPMITTTMTPGETADILMRVLPLVRDLKIESDTIPVNHTGWGEVIDIYEDGIPDNVIMFDAGQQKRLIRAITEVEIS